MTEFEGILKDRIKVYQDPKFVGKKPEEITPEMLKCNYRSWRRTEENIEWMRAKLATLVREELIEPEKGAYDEFTAEIARWDAGDHSPDNMDAGFFYCPYYPLEIEPQT